MIREMYKSQFVELTCQFRLPFIGGVVAPDQGFNPLYTDGEYKISDTTMIVSHGLGNSIIPVRLFNYPEIVCVELKCETGESKR